MPIGYTIATIMDERKSFGSVWKMIFMGTLVGTLPGLAKEFDDAYIDKYDLAADATGAFIGSTTYFLTKEYLWKK